MSTGTRERAADVLGAPVGASAAEVAAAFLGGLPAVGFVPTAARVAALNTLAGTNAPEGDGSGLSAEVEEFARRFWSLAPAERGTVWARLSRRAEGGPSAARLLDLRAGLDVPADPVSDPTAEEVAALARELFVLPPGARAVRRNGWLLANADRHAELVRGAAALARQRPALTALDPVLAARLTRAFDAAAFAEAANAEPLPQLPREPSRPTAASLAEEAALDPDGRDAGAATVSAARGGVGRALFFFGLFALWVMAKACGGLVSPPTDTPPPDQPPDLPGGPNAPPGHGDWTAPGMPDAGAAGPVQPTAPPRGGGVFLAPGVIEECRRYEREGGTKPVAYDIWVRSGRPADGRIPPFGAGAKP